MSPLVNDTDYCNCEIKKASHLSFYFWGVGGDCDLSDFKQYSANRFRSKSVLHRVNTVLYLHREI